MFRKIRLILQQRCKITPQDWVIVGVSGGPDSLFLLDVLAKLGQKMVVAHLDHSLRESSNLDAQYVAQLAQERGCPFFCERVEVRKYAAGHGLSIEDAARKVRYRFLFAQARKHSAKAVLVGHNADDQVETILMHVLRGSGIEGLRGMPMVALPNFWSAEIPLVRPLLEIRREQILAYLDEQGLVPLVDETNQDTLFLRNKFRLKIIPELLQVNPGLYSSLLRLSEIARGDSQVIDEFVDSIWAESLVYSGEGYVVLNLEAVVSRPIAVQRRLLRKALDLVLNTLNDVGFEPIERAVRFLKAPSRSRRMDWLQNVQLSMENEQIWIVKKGAVMTNPDWPQVDKDVQSQLVVPGKVILAQNWAIQAELVDAGDSIYHTAVNNADCNQTWLDAEKVAMPLIVRSRRTGDRFCPLGMEGHSTRLSDFMINHKMPSRARQAWPLVFTGDKLLWVPGYQPAHFARVTPATTKLLHLRLAAQGKDSGIVFPPAS